MGCGCGADAAKAVGAGCCNAPHRRLTSGCVVQSAQHSLGSEVGRAAQADGILPARRRRAHTMSARQNQRQRAGPKSRHQLLRKRRHLGGEMFDPRHASALRRHVDDQRVVGRAAFGGKDFGHCGVVVGVGTQAVHRLGR